MQAVLPRMHLLAVLQVLSVYMPASANAAAFSADPPRYNQNCVGKTVSSKTESCETERMPSQQTARIPPSGTTVSMSLFQAAMLSNKVGSSRVKENVFWSRTTAPKKTMKDGTNPHLVEIVKDSKSLGRQEAEIIVGETPDVSAMLAGSSKVIAFVVVLLVVVCVVVYFLVIRPKLGGSESPLPGHCVDTTSPTESSGKTSSTLPHEDSDVAMEIKFCPELVVPADKECALLLPEMALSAETFDISDVNGGTVLQVQHTSSDPWQVALTTVKGDIIAKCCAAPQSTIDAPEYHFLRSDSDYCAKLHLDDTTSNLPGSGRDVKPENFSITLPSGARLFMSVSHEQLVDFTDKNGQLLASLEPAITSPSKDSGTSPAMRLRVAPLSDAGLVICGVLCVGHYMWLRGILH